MKVSKTALSNWLATGFFLGKETFFENETYNDKNYEFNINWNSKKKYLSLSEFVKSFKILFEKIIYENLNEDKIILPLSGGLDSRTLAVAFRDYKNVVVISYEFEGGIKETEYAEKIADIYGWDFHRYKIRSGYLWDKLDILSNINECQTEFTHPRQMAIIKDIIPFGNVIASGQWGDVLFNSYGLKFNSNLDDQIKYIIKLIAKPGGIELSEHLWKYWEHKDTFKIHFRKRIKNEISKLTSVDPNSKVREFKTLHWAKRWADSNLKVFSSTKKMIIPYYDKRMLSFVAKIPENHLSKRKIQIEYIKRYAPEIASIPWQEYDLNLYRYKFFNSLYFPRRVYNYTKRVIDKKIFNRKEIIQRNWELQFLGDENDKNLKMWLFETEELFDIVPKDLIYDFYELFKNKNPVKYSHPISMLLTLAVWTKNFRSKN